MATPPPPDAPPSRPKRARLPAPRPLTPQPDTVLERVATALSLGGTFVSPSTGAEHEILSTVLIVALMLVSGTFNTILTKLQDQTCVYNCSAPEAEQEKFEQPLWQTLNMFIGEWVCLVVLYAVRTWRGWRGWRKSLYRTFYGTVPPELDVDALRSVYARVVEEEEITVPSDEDVSDEEGPVRVGNVGKARVVRRQVEVETEELKGWKVFLLMIPTVCDIIGTTVGSLFNWRFCVYCHSRSPVSLQLMNVGLLYTTASIYQMLRGSVVLFTGFLSFFFLRRPLMGFQWLSLLVIFAGIAIVGATPLLDPEPPKLFSVQPGRDVMGTIMILAAQLLTSSQFIIEERLLSRFSLHPMEAIGFEGTFGLFFLFLLAPPMYYFVGRHNEGSWFNLPVAWNEIISHPVIWGAGLGCIFSIALFNGSGLEVTKRLSATTRGTADACRTLLIWCASLALGWESFRWVQVCGFVGGCFRSG